MDEFDNLGSFLQILGEDRPMEQLLPSFQTSDEPSWPVTIEDIESAYLFGESSVEQQILLPSQSITEEEPTLPDLYQLNLDWIPVYGHDCSSCLTFRDIVHANELWYTKLSLHVHSDILQHAVLFVQPSMTAMPAQQFIADLRLIDVELVPNMISDYGNNCVRDGLQLIHDSCGPFFETMTTTMDYSDPHYYPTITDVNAGLPLQMQGNVIEYCSQNLSEISLPETPPSTKSVGNIQSAEGMSDGTGRSQQVQATILDNPRYDIRIQRERTKTITLDEISKYFHMPIVQASKELQICTTALKKICRRFNLKRWPYRKVLSQTMKIFMGKEFRKCQETYKLPRRL